MGRGGACFRWGEKGEKETRCFLSVGVCTLGRGRGQSCRGGTGASGVGFRNGLEECIRNRRLYFQEMIL